MGASQGGPQRAPVRRRVLIFAPTIRRGRGSRGSTCSRTGSARPGRLRPDQADDGPAKRRIGSPQIRSRGSYHPRPGPARTCDMRWPPTRRESTMAITNRSGATRRSRRRRSGRRIGILEGLEERILSSGSPTIYTVTDPRSSATDADLLVPCDHSGERRHQCRLKATARSNR
jgi:hypothetical protein